MPPVRFHLGIAYRSLERLLARIETHGLRDLPSVPGVKLSALRTRVVQRVVETVFPEYLKAVAKRVAGGQEPDLPDEEGILLDGIWISGSGHMEITRALVLRGMTRYAGHWAQMLIAIAKGASVRAAPRPATLVFGVPHDSILHEGDDHRFREYCREGPIEPLSGSRHLIVQASEHTESGDEASAVSYARYPLHVVASMARLGAWARLKLLGRHVASLFTYPLRVLKCPALALLAGDFAQLQTAMALDDAGAIEAVVLTNSHIAAQSLWMRAARHAKTHMLWYSQNSIPLVYRWDGLVSHVPQHQLMHVDVHWTWTSGFAAYLRSVNPCSTTIVAGPIVWYLPEKRRPRVAKDRAVLAVFDVTPLEDKAARDYGIGEYYYRRATMESFLQTIIELRTAIERQLGIQASIRLKHKREFSPLHDKQYIDWVARLVADGTIERSPVNENLFELVAGSTAVFVPPYSSPAYLADALGVPAIYFDPTEDLIPTFEPGRQIYFASGKEEFSRLATRVVADRLAGPTTARSRT